MIWMLRQILFGIVLVSATIYTTGLAGSVVLGQGEPARLHIDRLEIDADQVLQGEEVPFVFELRDDGQSPLEISIRETCRCTRPKFPKSILPGETGRISTTLATQNLVGVKRGQLILTTNDPNLERVPLNLVVTVVPALEVEPRVGSWELNSDGNSCDRFMVSIRKRNGDKLVPGTLDRIQVLETPYASARFSPMVDQPGRYWIDLDIGPEAPSGRSTLPLKVFHSDEADPTLVTVPCIKGLVSSPEMLSFGQFQQNAGQSATKPLLIRNVSGPFQVLNVTSSDPEVSVASEIIPVGSRGDTYRLSVTCRGTAIGAHRGVLKIETTLGQSAVAEIRTTHIVVAKP